MDKSKQASENFNNGYNCSQAVFLAYAKECGIDEESALKLSSSFGAGMGKMHEVCGAVTAMFMVEGLKHGFSDPQIGEEKKVHYSHIRELAAKFKYEHGSIICKELLSSLKNNDNKSKNNDNKKPCTIFVCTAAKILEDN